MKKKQKLQLRKKVIQCLTETEKLSIRGGNGNGDNGNSLIASSDCVREDFE